MSKRIVSGVLCGLLFMAIGMAIGCSEPKKPIQPDSCSQVPYKVLIKDGVRYLHVSQPDGNVVIINLDTLPPPAKPDAGDVAPAGSGSASASANFVLCPCEEDVCRPLCYQLRRLQDGANLCTR